MRNINKRALAIRIGIVTALGIATTGKAQTVVNLITNGDFSAGFSGWTPGYGPFYGLVEVDNEQLHWQQPSGVGGNAAGASQDMNVDVSEFDSLIFKCDVVPMQQNLTAPGYYGVEYPAQISITYIDGAGSTNAFRHGFHYDPEYDLPSAIIPGTFVARNTWYSYQTDDLLKLPIKPQTIINVRVYGSGWSYEGKADNVQLLAGLRRTPLQIITQPQSQLGYWGKSVSFSVTATNGTPPYSHQWLHDSVTIPDATNSLLVLTNLQTTNEGVYTVVVSDTVTNLTSQPATLTINPAGVSIALYAGVTIDGVVSQTYGIQCTSGLSNTNNWVGVTNITLTVPTELWYDSQPASHDVCIGGQRAFVAMGDAGLVILDISNPTNLVRVGGLCLREPAQAVTVAGSRAYVRTGSGFDIIDVSNPIGCKNLGHFAAPGQYTYRIAVAGNYAYVPQDLGSDLGLLVVDVSDPTNCVAVGRCNTGEWAHGVAVAGNYAFLAGYWGHIAALSRSAMAPSEGRGPLGASIFL
jgi:hypothetical protein